MSESVDGKTNVYCPSPVYEARDEQVCDAIVVCASSALIMEFKGSTFTAKAKYSGDKDLLSSEIDSKLVKSGKQKKGVRQLANAIHRLFDKRNPEKVKGLDLSSVATVYPVLVTRDGIGEAISINFLLNREFQKYVNKKQIRTRVTPLFSLSADEVEFISAYLREAQFSEILYARYRCDRALELPFHLVKNDEIGRMGDRRNPALKREFKQFADGIVQTLLPGSPPLRDPVE